MPRDFLFASVPLAGHVNPLRPLARELVERGHAVRWYAGRRYQAAVADTGAEYVPMGPEVDRIPKNPGRTGLAGVRFDFRHAFLDPAPAQVVELRRLIEVRQPDALIADLGFIGAGLLHELTGVPWVSIGVIPLTLPSRDTAPFGLAMPPSSSTLGRVRNRALNVLLERVLMRDVRAHYQTVRARVGLPKGGSLLGSLSPLLHLQNGIPDLEYPRSDLPPQVQFVGLLADRPGAATLPPWWDQVLEARGPIVHVTQGTVADEDVDLLVSPTIRALAGEDVLLVAGTGRGDASRLGALPANVRAAPFVPHDRLLPLVSAVVTNGGYGGVQAALSRGVPLIVAGATEDKPEVAARVAWSGAGIDLRTGRPTLGQIRTAVRSVLHDNRYAQRAGELRDIYAKLDAATGAANLIERLVTKPQGAPAER